MFGPPPAPLPEPECAWPLEKRQRSEYHGDATTDEFWIALMTHSTRQQPFAADGRSVWCESLLVWPGVFIAAR